MTRGSIQEYVEAIRGRYLASSKRGKGELLDQFTAVTTGRGRFVCCIERHRAMWLEDADAHGAMVMMSQARCG